jgi:hypothetical protein
MRKTYGQAMGLMWINDRFVHQLSYFLFKACEKLGVCAEFIQLYTRNNPQSFWVNSSLSNKLLSTLSTPLTTRTTNLLNLHSLGGPSA